MRLYIFFFMSYYQKSLYFEFEQNPLIIITNFPFRVWEREAEASIGAKTNFSVFLMVLRFYIQKIRHLSSKMRPCAVNEQMLSLDWISCPPPLICRSSCLSKELPFSASLLLFSSNCAILGSGKENFCFDVSFENHFYDFQENFKEILITSCFAASLQRLCRYWGLEGAMPFPNIYILMTFISILKKSSKIF